MTTAETLERIPEGGIFGSDFDELEVGDRYESPACPIGSRDVAVFAGLTGDTHPIHVDPEWAARGPFGRPIAHGLLVLSLAVGVLPLDPDRVVALRRLREVTFKRPVAVGEAIVVSCKVTALKPLDDASGLVECEWRIVGEDGRLRLRARVEILWRRGAAAAPALPEATVDRERDPGAPAEGVHASGGEAGGGDAELAPVVRSADGSVQVLV